MTWVLAPVEGAQEGGRGASRNPACRLESRGAWWPWVATLGGGILLACCDHRYDRPDRLLDLLLAPAVVISLYRILAFWTSRRAALPGAALHVVQQLAGWWLLDPAFGGLAARNLTLSGSTQLLVCLGAMELLLRRVLRPSAWVVLVLAASLGHPHLVFCPLLLMVLVRPEPLLRAGLIDNLRACALGTCLASLALLQLGPWIGGTLVRVDASLLPAAWWIGSWLMVEEIFMPSLARLITVVTFCACTVTDFRPWPGMAFSLLLACLLARQEELSKPAEAEPAAEPAQGAA